MSQIALYIVIYKFIYNYIEAGKAVFIFLNDLMTNDLNDHIFRFSCFVMSMQTAIIQGVKNCLPLGLADGAVSTDPSPTRQNGRRRPTSWARTGSMMLFSTATNLRLGFFARGLFQLTPLTNMWTRRTKPRRKPRLPWLTTEKLPSSTSRHYFWQIHRKRGLRIAFIENAIRK